MLGEINKPTRPVLRYHGGKFRLAPWVISHFPSHRTYVEPYGGAASVLMLKPMCYAEIYNEMDDDGNLNFSKMEATLSLFEQGGNGG